MTDIGVPTMVAWTRRVDTRQGDHAHGITFTMHERSGQNIRAEVAITSRKVHVEGKASLTLATNQYRYGDELIAQLYTGGTYQVADRVADGWTRVQIYFGAADVGTAAMLEALAHEIRCRVAGHGP